MTFDLPIVGLLILLAIAYALLPTNWRTWALFAGSIIGVYALQPRLQIRWLDFLLPTLTLLLTMATWFLTRKAEQVFSRDDKIAFAGTALLVIGLALLRYVPSDYRIFVASRPPNLTIIVGFALIILVISLVFSRLYFSHRAMLLLLLILFIFLKTDILATWISTIMRRATNQDVSQARAIGPRLARVFLCCLSPHSYYS
ncbi:MAG: hypothetical protein Q9P01_06095 [Anaerolineae bacterium]|nr:hypothetical protein [Anaerolineae bacterium]